MQCSRKPCPLYLSGSIVMDKEETERTKVVKRSFNVLLHLATDSEVSTPSADLLLSPSSSSSSSDPSTISLLLLTNALKPLPVLHPTHTQRVKYNRKRQVPGSAVQPSTHPLPIEIQLAEARRSTRRSLSSQAKASSEGIGRSLLGFRTLST